MNSQDNRPVKAPSGGFISALSLRAKLILRLMADRRVSPLLKLIPIGTLAYLVIPDLVIGPIDDAVVISLGMYLFVELCPPAVVQEHRQRLERELAGNASDVPDNGDTIKDEEIVDAEYWEEGK